MSLTSPALIISRHLIDTLGVFSDPLDAADWPLFVSSLPDQPNTCAAVYDSINVKDGRYMSGHTVEHKGIQFILRFSASEYVLGYSKGEALKTAMDAIKNELVVVDGSPYRVIAVSRSSGLIPISLEDGTKRRREYSINFMATIEEA